MTRILIVDDKQENLYMLRALLTGHGYEVNEACHGAEALVKARQSPSELIISDLLMPVMDGYTLLRHWKSDERLKQIPFIVYTATYTEPKDEKLALDLGADAFIIKPTEPEPFMIRIQEVLSRQKGGLLSPARLPTGDEEAHLKQYSESLIRKLEEKALQLEQANRALEQDIAERRLTEEKLRESESRFRLFAETAPVGVIIADQNQNAVYASKKFVELFGYTHEDAPTVEAWFSLAYPDEKLRNHVRAEWNAAVDKARKTLSEIKPMEYPVTCKDGSVREIEFRMSATADLDFVIFTDITERKQAEEEWKKLQAQFIQAQKMESVGRLAGGVAHDFNNMLGVIIGNAEMALDQSTPSDPIRAEIQEILEAARRSADITRQLLAFARRQIIAPKMIDLNETVQGMLKMLRRLIGEDIDLAWQPGAAVWTVKMDPSQIDQILANLCVNARDAIGGVGKITIETKNMRFNEAYCNDYPGFSPGDFVLLAVIDDGCGMDKETLHNLFEPFFTTKAVGEGTGLGLATVYGIVKQNDGFINVYSEPGKGSMFNIYLPGHAGEAAKISAETAVQIPRGHGEIVIVAEDETSILRLAQKMLTGLGYKVLAASTPIQALKMAETHSDKLDLLITDVVMPEMTGRDLAVRLQTIHPEIKVLFMSGYTADIIAHRSILNEDVLFIQKPFTKQELAKKVREALEGK